MISSFHIRLHFVNFIVFLIIATYSKHLAPSKLYSFVIVLRRLLYVTFVLQIIVMPRCIIIISVFT